jgi:uncharacterized SAM-binding protein YcdF (DUF218 family)
MIQRIKLFISLAFFIIHTVFNYHTLAVIYVLSCFIVNQNYLQKKKKNYKQGKVGSGKWELSIVDKIA